MNFELHSDYKPTGDPIVRECKEKLEQEQRSLINIPDGFKRVIVVEKTYRPWQTEEGTLVIGLEDFLLNEKSLEL